MGKIGFLTEGKAIQTLSKDEERIWIKHLTKEQKNELLHIFVDDEDKFKEEFSKVQEIVLPNLSEDELNKINSLRDKNLAKQEKQAIRNEKKAKQNEEYQNIVNNKVSNFLSKRGVQNPSQITIDLINSSNIYVNMDSVLNSVGIMTTLKLETQMQYNYYITSQNFAFVHAGQNDEIIKQNDKIIEQNEKVIELLEKLTNKL